MEVVAGVHTDCGRFWCSAEFEEVQFVCSGPSKGSRLSFFSEVEVWVQVVYFILTLQKSHKSYQRRKTFKE